MALAAPAAPGSMSLASTLPGVTPNQFASGFAAGAVGGGNPYSPAPPGQGIPSPMVDPNAMALGSQQGANPGGVQMVPGFGPIMSNYIDQFNKSIGASRAQINTQLAQALGELGQRRDAAAGVIAGLPGEIAQNTAVGKAQQAGANKAAVAGLDPGAAGAIPVGGNALQSALTQGGAGYAAMVPGLNLANMANSQSGAAMLRQQGMIGDQNLDDQQRQFMGQMDSAQLAGMQQKQASQTQFDQQKALAQQQTDLQARVLQQQEADAAANQVGLTGGAAQLKQISESPAYQYAVHAMNVGLFNQNGPGGGMPNSYLNPLRDTMAVGNAAGDLQKQSPQEIIDKYKTSNPDLLLALAANGLLPKSQVASTLNGNPAAKALGG